MKKAEFGRSILEVLSVLVIIALITVAGIRLWQEARLESQTHTLAQRLTSIKNSRLLSMNAHAGERMPRTEKGPYDTIFTIENGVGNQNKDWFWIDVKTNGSSLCGALAEFDIGAGYTKDECESSINVTFYFLKFPEAGSSTTPDKDNQPRECPPNTNCDNNFNPIGCVEGYFLSDGNCIECPENSIDCKDDGFECESGYYKNGNTCTSCGTGVLSCDSTGKPTACQTGYYLSDNSCDQCPTTGVASCEEDGFTCQDGYYKDGNACTSCGTGVLSCDSTGKPTACQTGYYLSDNSCVQCLTSSNCRILSDITDSNGCPIMAQACTSGVCKTDGTCATTCNSGEYNSNGYCCSIGQKYENGICTSCTSGEQCGCSNGTWDGEKCFECPENASTTVVEGNQIDNTACYCNEGFYWNNENLKCEENLCPLHSSPNFVCESNRSNFNYDTGTYECTDVHKYLKKVLAKSECYCDFGYFPGNSQGEGEYKYLGWSYSDTNYTEEARGDFCFLDSCIPLKKIGANWTREMLLESQDRVEKEIEEGYYCHVSYYPVRTGLPDSSGASQGYIQGNTELATVWSETAVGTYNGKEFYMTNGLNGLQWWSAYLWCKGTGGRMAKYQDLVEAGLCNGEKNQTACGYPNVTLFSKPEASGLAWLDDDCGYEFSLTDYNTVKDVCEENPAPNSAFSYVIGYNGILRAMRRDVYDASNGVQALCIRE